MTKKLAEPLDGFVKFRDCFIRLSNSIECSIGALDGAPYSTLCDQLNCLFKCCAEFIRLNGDHINLNKFKFTSEPVYVERSVSLIGTLRNDLISFRVMVSTLENSHRIETSRLQSAIEKIVTKSKKIIVYKKYVPSKQTRERSL